MTKSVDLLTLVEIFKAKSTLFEDFCEQKDISLKKQEIDCLNAMLSKLKSDDVLNNLRKYSIGFKIQQIGKEFDLLRIDNSKVINIELKSELDQEKILNQCIRNYYYLKFIRSNPVIITYEMTSDSFYRFNYNENNISRITTESFINEVMRIEKLVIDPASIFIARKYLVSPFNSTDSFLNDEYFLTNQQEDIMRSISSSGLKVFSIEGSAGTGKTLLVYHIAKQFILSSYDVRIIHCGQLNEGQKKLNNNSYNISGIKRYELALKDISSNSCIIVDESQRLNHHQIEQIFEACSKNDSFLIFSFDKMQVLSKWEENLNSAEKIIEKIPIKNQYKLTNKIRTNDILNNFVFCLIDCQTTQKYHDYSSAVEYSYVSSFDLAKDLAETLTTDGWKVINPTPSLFSSELHDDYIIKSSPNAHTVIGQEFDRVAVIIPSTFLYNDKGQLLFNAPSYYKAEKMFYQALSRTREKLHLIIVNNPLILERMLHLKI